MKKPNDTPPGDILRVKGMNRRAFLDWLYRRPAYAFKQRSCTRCGHLVSPRYKESMHGSCFIALHRSMQRKAKAKVKAEYVGEPVATTEEKQP